ncbi:MAG: AAA family ATPase [Spirochaetia bacterium]|nr:AAA family ATPase [Spirochaetia bacterium]
MSNQIHKIPGAKWWKFDFHAHTPASVEDYGRGDTVIKNITPEEWLLNYMKAGIDCVCVTDHNTGDWIDKLKVAYNKMQAQSVANFRELYIFPGVEITANNNVHILAVLNETAKSQDIGILLGACGHKINNGKITSATSKIFLEVVDEIVNAGGIAIPAHADKTAGLFEQIKDGNTLAPILTSENIFCAEVIDPSFQFPELYKSKKTNWAGIIGSDSHVPDQVGEKYTWVKMGKPSLEGLKLALMDGNDFSLIPVYDKNKEMNPNKEPDQYIRSIEIQNAQFCGNGAPLTIHFSPWLNCIIGGRGSGKSTIVEFIRIALRREKGYAKLGDESEVFNNFKNFFRQPEARGKKGVLRENTSAEAECILDNAAFKVSWSQDGSLPPIQEILPDGQLKASQGEVAIRFPVGIYSQKEMFEIASKPEALLNIIDDAPEVNFREWQNVYQQLCAQYRSLKTKSREFETLIKEETGVIGELEDVKRKLSLFEKGENAEIRKKYNVMRSQEKEVNEFIDSLDKNLQTLTQIQIEANTPNLEVFGDEQNETTLKNSLKNYINKVEELNNKFTEIKEGLKDLSTSFDDEIKKTNWYVTLNTVMQEFTGLNEKLKSEGVGNPDEYGIYIQKRQTLEAKITNIQNLKKSKQDVDKQAAQELEKIKEHRNIITANRKKFVSSVLSANKYIKIEIIECGSLTNLEKEFRVLISKEDGFQNEIISENRKEGLLKELFTSFSFDKLQNLKNEIKSIKDNQATNGKYHGRFITHIQKYVTEELLDSIDLWFPEDGINVAYNRDPANQKFIPIEQGSPGQKTAAILAFLLTYGTEPIILDQPEDDLDNHLIFELVVKQFRENKKRRQIVVVTHNPNIVVNGDAEMIYALDFKNGQTIVTQGGCLQEKEIRLEVCRVMEGGKIAFEQRYRRINMGDLYV